MNTTTQIEITTRITSTEIAAEWLDAHAEGWRDLLVNGEVRIARPCGRCGGSGYGSWRPDGGVCFECRGADTRNRHQSFTVKTYGQMLKARKLGAIRHQAAIEAQYQRKLDSQRDWCEANGFGRLTFDEKNEKQTAEREAKYAAERAQSVHVGTVGKRQDFTLTVNHVHSFDGMYGPVDLYIMQDESGNAVTWKSTSTPLHVEVEGEAQPTDSTGWWALSEWNDNGEATRHYWRRKATKGDVVTLKGTVKEHGEYKGGAQTRLVRCKQIK